MLLFDRSRGCTYLFIICVYMYIRVCICTRVTAVHRVEQLREEKAVTRPDCRTMIIIIIGVNACDLKR